MQADRSPIAEEGWFQVGRLGQFPVDHRLSEGEGAFALSSTTKQCSPTTLAVAIVTMVDRALQDEHAHVCALVAVAPRV